MTPGDTACDLCHNEPAASSWHHRKVCAVCLTNFEYYESLTPEERRREDESIARHVAESPHY